MARAGKKTKHLCNLRLSEAFFEDKEGGACRFFMSDSGG
jgi:hypothetical protein